MRRVFALLAILAAGGLAFAVAEEAAPDHGGDLEACKSAIAKLSLGDVAGFEPLLARMPEANREHLASTIDSQAVLIKQHLKEYGEPIGTDLIEIKEVGRVLRRYYFITRYDGGCVQWDFSFYRAAKDWEFRGYHFETNENTLFSELGRSVPIAAGAVYSAVKPETTAPPR